MKNTNYTELLNLFVNDDEMREWQNKPFKIGDKAIATDSYAMVIINANLSPEVQDLTEYDNNNVLKCIPKAGESLGKIKIEDIRELIRSCPKVNDTKACDACEGDGEVEFSFEWNRKTYEESLDCPLCNGDGEVDSPTAAKIMDESKKIKIGMSHFSSKMIFRLGMACKITGTDLIDVVYHEGEKLPTLLRINNADLLIMPVSECKGEDYLGEILIHN